MHVESGSEDMTVVESETSKKRRTRVSRSRSLSVSPCTSCHSSATFSPSASENEFENMVPYPQQVQAPTSFLPIIRKAAIEVFCGHAGLAAKLSKEGFEVIGIDSDNNKDKPMVRCIIMDLATATGQKEFWELIGSLQPRLVYVHFAPPCGTSSLARNFRLSGGIDPKPLRSEQEPDGLSTLDGANKVRVEVANKLYEFVARAVVMGF